MFKAITIEGFRGIKQLELRDIPRINLIVGENNIGKTSILEAISILTLNSVLGKKTNENLSFASTKALLGWIYKLSFDRNSDDNNRHYQQGRSPIELNRDVIYPTIYGREPKQFDGFLLRGKEQELPNYPEGYFSEEVGLKLALEYFLYQSQVETDIELSKRYNDINSKGIASNIFEQMQTGIPADQFTEVFRLKRNSNRAGTEISYPSGYDFNQDRILSERLYGNINMQYVKSISSNTISNSLLYDKIVFEQHKMEYLIRALKVIDPEIEQFAYQGNEFGERSARIKLKNMVKPISITTMGDGISRILAIILAMVNCTDGYLLIDEFENGLHYSVQKKLWEIIFYLAAIYNVQVFVTTHSNDTIQAFTSVLNSYHDNIGLGRAYRFQKSGDGLIAINYSPEELQSSSEFDIEIR